MIIKEVEVKGRKWNKESLKDLLKNNDMAVIRALLLIYSYQTESEKEFAETTEDNGMGFNGVDAEILTSFVNWYKAHNYLSEKQMFLARKKIMKYAQQILNHMYNEQQKEVANV